jgi:two-component sensor histidine kinase
MLQITVTVKSTNHADETVITKTADNHGGGNPAFDAEETREIGHRLVEHIAGQLDKLAPAKREKPRGAFADIR